MSMQNELNHIVKETIAPLFKKNGFKKKGKNFAKIFPDFAWTVNIQSSKWNTKNEVEFLFNTGIYCDKVYTTLSEMKSPIFPLEVNSMLRLRISDIKNIRENWYKISDKTDIEEIKKQVESDIVNVIIPYFEQYQNIEDIINVIELKEELGRFEPRHHLTLLYHYYGYPEKAQKRMKEVYLTSKFDSQKEYIKELSQKIGINVN
ncbi:DUF4304 domain-containing protein [Gottfriedia acidiceleris]|uniref:DUF4304 domain-containing protein n=1 Tax=Gottfriedia acidiceleris TaxID=371036 RepID=UPI003D22FB37